MLSKFWVFDPFINLWYICYLWCIECIWNAVFSLLDCARAAEQLKNNPRHKSYLEQVSLRQLEKLFSVLRGHLRGQSLTETMDQIQRETTIDPEEDLNKLDDKELAKRKRIMDELFEKNRKKKDDPNFVYDIEVEFPQDEQVQSCSWDTESADEFWHKVLGEVMGKQNVPV